MKGAPLDNILVLFMFALNTKQHVVAELSAFYSDDPQERVCTYLRVPYAESIQPSYIFERHVEFQFWTPVGSLPLRIRKGRTF